MANDTKMIKVTSRGYVMTSRGRCLAPIRTPYRENISKIWSMITSDRADVWEKLPNGDFIKLTPQNFDKDNSNIPKMEKKLEETKQVEPVILPSDSDKETKTENIGDGVDSNITPDVNESDEKVDEVSDDKEMDEVKPVDMNPQVSNNQNKNNHNNKWDKKNKHNQNNNNGQKKNNGADLAVTPEHA